MGYMRHHAIIVTSWTGDALVPARQAALSIFPPDQVSGIVNGAMNGYASFFVGPDGSKEKLTRG